MKFKLNLLVAILFSMTIADIAMTEPAGAEKQAGNQKYKCDGRTHCSQMTSCEEAKFFIKNCPNTKMDGNNNGIPCEKQWCK
ncbi:MAG: excalibur calcium-binding domain-containing protein [Candidatus Electronema sp. V4]|uniref:excalibur calcium-binding domain-containing protein n=1 Tax=Candidatus Electronema sp. V4 TaxID=3454756 RepID=UPI00405598FF